MFWDRRDDEVAEMDTADLCQSCRTPVSRRSFVQKIEALGFEWKLQRSPDPTSLTIVVTGKVNCLPIIAQGGIPYNPIEDHAPSYNVLLCIVSLVLEKNGFSGRA